jgi:hypothetical protein
MGIEGGPSLAPEGGPLPAAQTFEQIRARLAGLPSYRYLKRRTPQSVALQVVHRSGELCEAFQWKAELSCDLKELSQGERDAAVKAVGRVMVSLIVFAGRCQRVEGSLYVEMHEVLVLYTSTSALHPVCSVDGAPFFSRSTAELPIKLLLNAFADRCAIDLPRAIAAKMDLNERKYPANLVRGKSGKYTVYSDQTGVHKHTQETEMRRARPADVWIEVRAADGDSILRMQGDARAKELMLWGGCRPQSSS